MGSANYSVLITPVLDTGKIQQKLDNLNANLTISVGKDSATVKAAVSTGKQVGKTVSENANKEMEKSFGQTLAKTLKNRLMYAAVDTAISSVSRGLKDAVANVIELDASLTELKKVTTFTSKELNSLTDSAYEAGTSVGRTGNEMIQAATEFAKMSSKYTKTQLLELAEVASMYQNIADSEVSAADAASLINSQLRAFEMDATKENALTIIDKINEVSNNFAVSSTNISQALTKTSSAMATYGNDINQTIAIVTAGTEVMTGQAAKVARGWRTIGSNLVKLAQETDVWTAADGKVSVRLRDDNNELISTYDILNELYPQWQKLGRAEKSNLALSIAGKSHLEVFTATMNNFSHAIDANKTAMDANGSAMEENEKYLDSIEGRVAKFRSAWEQFSKDLINSDLIKGLVSTATVLIKILDKIVSTIGGVPGSVVIIAGLAKGISAIAKATASLKASYLGMSIIPMILGQTPAKSIAEIEKASAAIGGASGGGGLIKNISSLVNRYKLLKLASSKATGQIKQDVYSARDALEMSKQAAEDEIASFDKLLFTLKDVGLAFAGVGAAIAVIAGLKVVGDWVEKITGFESNVEKSNEASKKFEKTQNRINELTEKRKNNAGKLTEEEERELQILEAELSVLRDQIKEYDRRAAKAASKELGKENGDKLTESVSDTGILFLHSGDDIQNQKNKINSLKNEMTELLKMKKQYEKEGKDTSNIDKSISGTQDEIEKAEDKLEEYRKTQKQLAAETINEWNEMKATYGKYYSSLDKEAKAVYDNLHREAILATDGIKKSVANLASDMVSLFGSNTFDAFNLDLTSFKNADELTQAVLTKLQAMPENKQIKLYARDEAGNIIDEVKFKAKELTEGEWSMLIKAQAEGDWDEVEEYLKLNPNQSKFAEVVAKVKNDSGGTSGLFSKEQLNPKATVKYKANTTVIDAKNASIQRNPIYQTVYYVAQNKKKAGGKRKGEEGGSAWLGDEGDAQNPKPELVVGKDGAYLAGTSGWELYDLKSSDTVYTYAQTKKLLGGSQKFSGHVGSLPMYASGTNNEAFDDELAELEYQRAVKHWTDDYYLKQYKSLYSRYAGSLSASQVHSYGKFAEEVATNKAKAEVDRLQGILEETGRGLDDLVKKINNDSHFSADEKKELLQDAYKASVEYNTKEYKNGKDTRAKILEDIKKYYETRGSYDEEYYSMLNDLREADQDLEVERLSKLSNAEDEKLTLAQKYLQQQLDAVKKQIEANEEEADSMKDLKELQQDLADARQDMVRIYREGVGWVYEQNAEAIKDAQKAIEDYNREHMSDELEAEAEALQKVLDLFDDMQELSDIKELELSLGVGSLAELIGGNFGTNIAQWTKWIKSAIATQVGLEDLSTQIKNATGTDIDTWLGDVLSGGSHQASASAIASYISKHSFAGGTLSAGGGLSLVGENGAELAWLRKGDSVYSNAISSNLMQWGRYSPAEVLSGVSGGNKQTFNFDKIVLPNVKNADDFYKELQKLPNKAIQQSAMRA